ncbi:MAG: hypothetical protein H0Z25_08205 [Kosmotoga sp.]|uniref:hypothetical protein n=1 Tax=Kosmotoga sp. TaxID=1955248 RepID=UPI001D756236|nr:hypothetical protein [Kosmotoga sp.]MBO8167181.1 hypothetical protein [Kosmotoga sp.]
MKTRLLIFIAVLMLLGVTILGASDSVTQNIIINVKDIAVLNVTVGSVTLEVNAPVKANAGDSPVVSTSVDGGYLRYTSIVESGKTRKITAQLDTDVPTGLALKLLATAPSGGTGTLGSPASNDEITLSKDTAQDIITGISSGWTGTETTSGAKLTYSLEITDGSKLNITNPTITITFTLTEA